MINVIVKWKKSTFTVNLVSEATVLGLKQSIQEKTQVSIDRQSLLWKNKPRNLTDSCLLSEYGFTDNNSNRTVTMVGSTQQEISNINNYADKITALEETPLNDNENQDETFDQQIVVSSTKKNKTIRNRFCKKLPNLDQFIDPDFKFIDDFVQKLDSYQLSFENTVKVFKNYVENTKSKISSNLIIARLIFTWISTNIEYDIDAWLNEDFSHTSDIDYIFSTKKTCCFGYAFLFKVLCEQSGMCSDDVKIINGVAKGLKKPNEILDENKTNHAWNIVRVDNKWKLVDTTWGAGMIDYYFIDSENDYSYTFRRQFNDFWFCTLPEEFLFTHFSPQQHNEEYRFLSNPILFSDWIKLPDITWLFFKFGIKFIDTQFLPKDNEDILIDHSNQLIILKFLIPVKVVLFVNLVDKEHVYFDNTHITAIQIPTENTRILNVYCNFKDLKQQQKYKLNVFAGPIHDCKYYICSYRFFLD